MSKKGKKSKKWMRRVYEFGKHIDFREIRKTCGNRSGIQFLIDYRTSIENVYKAHERHEKDMFFNDAFSNILENNGQHFAL